MRQQSQRMAVCGIAAALGVVVMLLGAVLELDIYVCPLLVGLSLLSVGKRFGTQYQILLWIAISILSFLLVPNPEETLVFAGLFGWYPILQPRLSRFPKALQTILKLLIFNTVIVALEALVIYVLVPEALEPATLLFLLLLGNVMFLMYDRIIARYDVLEQRLLQKLRRP